MNFRVLLEHNSSHPAHLAVEGADQTLCCEPVSRFVPSVRTSPTDDIPWCWICRTTAAP